MGATTGQWKGKSMSMMGKFSGNHAKLGHSLEGALSIMGDMNQDGSYAPEQKECASSQNGRGGLFFVVNDVVLHQGLQGLLTGDTAAYGPSPSPSPPTPSPIPPAPPAPSPSGSC